MARDLFGPSLAAQNWSEQVPTPTGPRFNPRVTRTHGHAHNCTQLSVGVCVCVCVCVCACACACACVSQPAQGYLATELLRAGGGLGAEMVEGEDAVAAVRDLERGSWQSAADGASVSSAMPPLQIPTPTDPRFNDRGRG